MKPENRNIKMSNVRKMTLGFTGVAGFHFWDGKYLKEDSTYHTELWKNTFRAQNHMNGDDVINTLSEGGGYWGHRMQEGHHKNYKGSNDVEAVEMQAYVSNNEKLIVGYVRNRTYNVYTKGSSGSDCGDVVYDVKNNEPRYVKELKPINSKLNIHWDDIKNSEQLKVDGVLALKKYDVDFYGDVNGSTQYISTDSKLTSASGKLKLRYPELQVEESWQNRPVIWFVAKREGYNGMRQNNDISEDSTDVFLMELLANEQDPLFQESSLKVYPNPFDNFFTIDSPISESIIIQELSGKVIKRQKISKGKTHIQTGGLMKGVYFIRFLKQSKTFKIVKQ